MVDTVTTSKPENISDDWEVAVDTGEFDKQLEHQEKTRTANQEPVVTSTTNDDESQNSSSINLMKSNKPIRILKRPISQSQLLVNNNVSNSTNSTNSTMASNNINSSTSSSSSTTVSNSSTTAPSITIIPRSQTKDSTNSSQTANPPGFVNNMNANQSVKPPIKTYEQRELEYRLARLRIMGEEESSAKDDDDVPTNEPNSSTADEVNKVNIPLTTPNLPSTRTNNKINSGPSQQQQQLPLQCHSTPGSYASNLYALNNMPSNTGTIHFTPNHNSTPTLGLGPFSSPNFPQHYRAPYSAPYSHMPTPGSSANPRYSLPVTTNNNPYMTPSAQFASAPSSASISSSYHYPTSQHPAMANNNWYHYPPQQTPYGTQQYGHPQ